MVEGIMYININFNHGCIKKGKTTFAGAVISDIHINIP